MWAAWVEPGPCVSQVLVLRHQLGLLAAGWVVPGETLRFTSKGCGQEKPVDTSVAPLFVQIGEGGIWGGLDRKNRHTVLERKACFWIATIIGHSFVCVHHAAF